jgi:hypothetical protein
MLDEQDATLVLTFATEAGRQLSADDLHQAELRRWIACGRADGIPADALPLRPERTLSPVRDADFLLRRCWASNPSQKSSRCQ